MVQAPMRKLLLALGLLLPLAAAAQTPVGPPNQILCNKTASAVITTNTTTSLVNGSGITGILICGWHATSSQPSGNANTFQFVFGTQGGPCGSPVAVTPPIFITNTAPSADHVDYGQIQGAGGQQLCVVTTGTTTTAVNVMVWYNQL